MSEVFTPLTSSLLPALNGFQGVGHLPTYRKFDTNQSFSRTKSLSLLRFLKNFEFNKTLLLSKYINTPCTLRILNAKTLIVYQDYLGCPLHSFFFPFVSFDLK